MLPTIYPITTIGDGFLATMGRPRAGDWLETEFCGLRKLGVRHVVSLLEPVEAHCLGHEAEHCTNADLAFTHFPIPDRGTPRDAKAFLDLAGTLYEGCVEGRSSAIHCRAGIGRASLLATAVLLHHGMTVDEAFAKISNARGVDVPDTKEQRQWLEKASAAYSS